MHSNNLQHSLKPIYMVIFALQSMLDGTSHFSEGNASCCLYMQTSAQNSDLKTQGIYLTKWLGINGPTDSDNISPLSSTNAYLKAMSNTVCIFQ